MAERLSTGKHRFWRAVRYALAGILILILLRVVLPGSSVTLGTIAVAFLVLAYLGRSHLPRS